MLVGSKRNKKSFYCSVEGAYCMRDKKAGINKFIPAQSNLTHMKADQIA